MKLSLSLLAASTHTVFATLRGRSRELAPYQIISTDDLGGPNPDAAIGNPLKGLVESPLYTWPPYESEVPLALEFYYVGLDEIMKGNPDVVGESAAFDWSVLDDYLSGSASRNMHAVWRVILHFPGQDLKVPQYLLDAGVEMRNYGGGQSPYYGDEQLVEAMGQFIERMGDRYDSDKRLAFVQAGLLGFWGEWHSGGNALIPEETKDKVIDWYASAFRQTQIQLRSLRPAAYSAGFGVHDDSFGFSTLDGDANGGVEKGWYTWPELVENNHDDFWKKAAMGGETRPEIQGIIFEPSYPARTYERQDFMECVEVTHASYIFHHQAFKNGGFSGEELSNALYAHANMGYNFYVPMVAVSSASSGTVDIDVTVTNIGVAPFYYDLDLVLECEGISKKIREGVDSLIQTNESQTFSFSNIPDTSECLNAVTLSLDSSYAYADRPIKFAQGSDGTLTFRLDRPNGQPPAPTAPVPSPVVAPVPPPTTRSPVVSPSTNAPVEPAPVTSPTTPSSSSCSAQVFLDECSTTQQCQGMYSGATDCSNSGGGVCYCGSRVCGCDDDLEPGPLVSSPESAPILAPSTPSSSSCDRFDFQNECSATWQCQEMYSGADDCWNGGGGVCYCGDGVVCGCQ